MAVVSRDFTVAVDFGSPWWQVGSGTLNVEMRYVGSKCRWLRARAKTTRWYGVMGEAR